MGRRGPLRLGLALAFVLVAQQTLADQVCKTGCKGNSQTFKYVPGTTYKYNYEGKIDISLSSAEGQITSIDVKAVVLLTQLGDCNQLLRLQNVQVLSGNKKHGQIPDVDKAIQLNFHDGHIEDSICTEPGDTQNSLNLKRAVASLFQANLKGGHETDIFGLCPTEVSQHKEGADVVIVKNRDLNKCAYRENLRQDFFATTFNLNSEIKSSPILNGNYNAKLKIKNGILNQANVVENYLYVPFSVGKNGAKAEVTSKLHFVSSLKDSPKIAPSLPKSIIFDNPHPVVAPTSNVNIILNAVKEVANSIDIVVGEKTAKEFVNLIKTVRVAKKADLLAVYNQVSSGVGIADRVAAKKIYLDAILQSGSGDGIEAAITLLKSNQFSDDEKRLVYIGMSLVKHATEASITTASQLLALQNLPDEAYLGIGNLVGRYCKQHSCKNAESVKQITQKLIQKIGEGNPANKQAENNLILILKTLANFGHLTDNVAAKVAAIAENNKVPDRLRAVALEVFLSDPCKEKIRAGALQILQNIQQDSELRIRAYLVLAQCPNAKVGNAVKALLEKEPSYQVGGFIVSHIRNLRASANPDKHLAKQFLGFSVPHKFPIDFRKWSFNSEISYAFDTVGASSSVESNIIFSEKSFLPTYSSLNLTAELFGHSFNFLELNVRQENLDRLVEHYFGPKGVLRTSSLSELLKNNNLYVKLWDDLNNKLEQSLRARRDVTRKEIENIGKAVQIKENQLDKDLDLDLSVKAFGSEVFFHNLNTYQEGLSPEAIIDNIVNCFNKGLDRLKSFEETFRTNIQFLDVEVDYPTSLGFPLRLAAEGTSNSQVKTEGSIDVRALLNNKDTNIHVKLIPSASIEVSGRLTLDALVVENGLKVVSTLYTSTGGDVNVKLYDQGQGVDVKVGLPVQIQKLISANHEIVFESREHTGQAAVTPLKFAQAKDFAICLDQLSPIIGLAFCAEVNGPNLAGKQVPVLPFPLAGDAKGSISIENEDVSEFHIKNFLNHERTSGEILLETIGKNGQKKLTVQLQGEIYPEKFVKAVLSSPLKSAFVEGRLINTNQEKSLLLKASQDNDEIYLKFGVGIAGSPNRAVYSPILEYRTPYGEQQLPIKVDGKIIAEENGPNRKYTFDNVKIHLPNQAIALSGNVGCEGQAIFSDLTISDGRQSATVTGRVHLDQNQLTVNGEVKNTLNPAFNFHLDGGVKRTPDSSQIDSNWKLVHGQDLSSKTNVVTLSNSITRRFATPNDFTFGFKHKFSYPLVGFILNVEAQETARSLGYDFDFEYNDIKFGSELQAEADKKTRGDFDLLFEIYGLENKLGFKAIREVQGEIKSQIDSELDINGMKLQVKGLITHNIKPTNVDIGGDLTVVLPTHPIPFKVDSGLQYSPSEIAAHHKVTNGNNIIIDATLNVNKNGNANGNVKVNIKDILVVNGQLKAVKGNGNGHIQINAITLKKVVRFESNFDVQPPNTYKIVLIIFPSYDKDKNQKLVFSTDNKISPTNVNSKNSIDLLGKVLVVNVNGAKSGTFDNGKHNGEVEIILPNGQYLLGKINTNYNTNGDVLTGQDQASLEYRPNKQAPGRKVSVAGKYNTVNHNDGIYDVVYNVAGDDANGKNINADIVFKAHKEGESRVVDYSSNIYGSILKEQIKSALKFKYLQYSGDFEISSSYGAGTNGKIGGKYDVRGGKVPLSGEIDLQILLPNENLKSLKSKLSGSVLLPRDLNEELKVEVVASLYADDKKSPAPLIDFSTDGQVRATDKDGEIKGNLNSAQIGPASLVAGYSRKELGDNKSQINGNLAVQCGKGHNYKVDGSLTKLGKNQYKLEAEVDTPYEDFKKNNIIVDTKWSEDRQHIESQASLNNDGKLWKLDTELKVSDIAPLINVKAVYPDGKFTELHLKGNTISEKEFGAEWKYQCQVSDVLFEGNVDVNAAELDNFSIKGNLNSPTLNLNKVSFEASTTKGAKAAKKLQIHIKSAGQNVVSGSTSYQAKEEHGKYIIEGTGSLKVKEETKAANFKYIVQELTTEKNGEQGFDIAFDAALGNQAIDAEFKFTNKQFRILDSYCEKNKECAHFELDSKILENEINKFNHILEITVDLRKIGLPNEFGLKAVTNRQNYVLDHNVELHFQNPENTKYQYKVYLHPDEAGASLTTPHRIIALESFLKGPQGQQIAGKYEAELAFYLDKKGHPKQKAAINSWINIEPNGRSYTAEAELSHPGLARSLSVSVKSSRGEQLPLPEIKFSSTLDVFAQPGQKLLIDYQFTPQLSTEQPVSLVKSSLYVKSAGLGINILANEEVQIDRQSYSANYYNNIKYQVGKSNYDNVLSISGNKQQSEVLLKLLNVELFKIQNKYSINKDEQIVDSEFSYLNKKPIISHLEIKKYNTLSYSIGHKENPKTKLQINAGFIPGQIADIRADRVTGGGKVNLFLASIKLDDANFLKPDYNVNAQAIEDFLQNSKQQASSYLTGIENISKEFSGDLQQEITQLSELSKKAAPDFRPLKNYYNGELEKIKSEILQDKSLREFGELVKSVFFTVADLTSTIAEEIFDIAEAFVTAAEKILVAFIESIEEQIIPALKELIEKFSGVVGEIVNSLVEIVASYLATVTEIIEKYQPDIKQLVAMFGELGQDISRFIQKSYEEVRSIFDKLYDKIAEELRAIPLFEEFKEEWDDFVENGLPDIDGLIGGVNEIAATIKDLIPPEFFVQPEIAEIIDITVEYFEKKIKQQPVDDLAVLEQIVSISVKIFDKFSLLLTDITSDIHQPQISISLDFIKKLPKLVAIRFSPISYILQEDISNELINFGLSLWNTPDQWIPPFSLFAMSLQGQNIFTFDGKYFNFPANCKYLLARDAVDGNFTIVGTFSNGLLTAITLADKEDTITYNSNGQVTLNNAHTDLPARKPGLSAYTDYIMVTIKSTAGVKVHCTQALTACGFYVSGFYHGDIKGLLGKGNNEPYDDFTVANGKIVTSEADFGNSYKIGQCEPVVVPPPAPSNPACEKLFSWDSSMRLCYPFVDTEIFKQACAQSLAAKVPQAELTIAAGYVATCVDRNIPITVPPNLVECHNGAQPFTVGDKFSVKVPGNAADIVLLVDTVKSNEPVYNELVKPLVQELTKGLTAKGLTDIDIHLITYGGENQWPSHVTVNGKLTFKGKAPDLKFENNPKDEQITGDLSKAVELLRSILKDVELAFGLDLQARTYSEGYDYPFRANAAKAIIAVTGSPCEIGTLYPLQKLRTVLYSNNLISLHLFTPFDGLKVQDPTKTKDVIGFNDEHVFTYALGKKKPGGTAELYKDLIYNDYCVDFTIKNRGNVFVTNNFLEAKPELRKQFVHVASHNVVEEIASLEEGLDCECKLVSPYSARNVCEEAYSKEKPAPAAPKKSPPVKS